MKKQRKGGIPLQKNDIFPMRAENPGADMEGVCRHDGMTVFVDIHAAGVKPQIYIMGPAT